MILLNTSFHMHLSVECRFLSWVRNDYAPALERHGRGMGKPMLMKMLIQPDSETVSYCFQMTAESEERALQWHESTPATELRDELQRTFSDKIVHFTSYMEILPL